jgi:hypothetical protein
MFALPRAGESILASLIFANAGSYRSGGGLDVGVSL